MEGRTDLALMGYLKASELGYQRAQANAAWILNQNQGIPSGQSATSYVQPGIPRFSSALIFWGFYGALTLKVYFSGVL